MVFILLIIFSVAKDYGAGRACVAQLFAKFGGRYRIRNIRKVILHFDIRIYFGALHAANARGFAVFAGKSALLDIAASHVYHLSAFF